MKSLGFLYKVLNIVSCLVSKTPAVYPICIKYPRYSCLGVVLGRRVNPTCTTFLGTVEFGRLQHQGKSDPCIMNGPLGFPTIG